MEDLKDFEKQLVDQLEASPGKVALKNYTDVILDLKRQGFIIDKILKKGIPVPIEYIVKCRIDKAKAASLTEFIVKAKYDGLEIFPYGIPWPEIFGVNVILNDSRIG